MNKIENVDEQEISKFSRLAKQWWDPNGDLKTLHDINSIRLRFIMRNSPLNGKNVLDVGCGGGILSEAMAKEDAIVTGIDRDEMAIDVAKQHQLADYSLCYLKSTAEEMAETHKAEYDIVTCLEMLEHVPDPGSVIKACSQLVKPQGFVYFSTLNRTLKAYALAILGAEYVLRILPRGTHRYEKLLKPAQLADSMRQNELHLVEMKGINYNPLTRESRFCDDVSVNYIICGVKE